MTLCTPQKIVLFNVSVAKTEGFTVCLLNMGVIRKPTVASYLFISSPHFLSWVHHMFPRNLLQLLTKPFHLMDERNLASPGEPEYNWYAKI
jgi:hypothetical protein